MKYKVTIYDVELEDTYEFKINNMTELRDILECFKYKTIEVEVNKIEEKTLRRVKENKKK